MMLIAGSIGCSAQAGSDKTAVTSTPVHLHPDNPHYLVFRGQPVVLVTSGEHYGAVLNRDFDYISYLDALASAELNLTRTFTGSYLEGPDSIQFLKDAGYLNTLAPAPDSYVAPWRHGSFFCCLVFRS